MVITNQEIKKFQNQILHWYKYNGRHFSWRNKSATNYHKIISEVLLQRTKAETVARFFPGFIKKYPSWSQLGNANEQELQDILNANTTDSELAARGLERSDFNMNVGQSELRNSQFFANLAIPIGDQAELYAFGGLGFRDGNATGFYRLPYQNRTFTAAYPNGFLPQIHSNIVDKSLAVGIQGKLGDWNVDFSNTYGQNSFSFNIKNSFNASLQKASPFEAN